jgi:hypothetical protein
MASLVLVTTACAPSIRVDGDNAPVAAAPLGSPRDTPPAARFFGDEFESVQRALADRADEPLSPTF